MAWQTFLAHRAHFDFQASCAVVALARPHRYLLVSMKDRFGAQPRIGYFSSQGEHLGAPQAHSFDAKPGSHPLYPWRVSSALFDRSSMNGGGVPTSAQAWLQCERDQLANSSPGPDAREIPWEPG